MKRINILPESIANKIAAGEVVQRPESVVKELLENSVDAGAKNIDLIIKQAGKSLIQVIDDGSGMTEEDAVLSVKRHATSKIKDVKDLERIYTFGFRGEALSSISAVSKFELKTQMKGADIGTFLLVEDGKEIKIEKGSFPVGTSISVKNLFYNVPARKNFLKSNATEFKHIVEAFKRVSLSNCDVSFRFYNDNVLIYDLKAGSLKGRISEIFKNEITDSLVEVDEPTDLVKVKGFVAKPAFLKRNKGDQYLFVNRRFVQSKVINHAIFTAYENILEKGDYPFFVIFLEIDPARIDINIHPQKLDIKFEDENAVYKIVNAIIKKSLGSYDLVPKMNFLDKEPEPNSAKLSFNTPAPSAKDDFSDFPVTEKVNKKTKILVDDNDIDALFDSIGLSGVKKDVNAEPQQKEIFHKNSSKVEGEAENSSFIVALHNKYILSQIKSGLMIIDAHVAHERILYEKALKSLNSNMPFSQQLLFSQTLTVDPGDFELYKELEPYLNKLGFEVKFFGSDTIVIDGVPSDIKMGSESQILREILEDYKDNQLQKNLDIREKMAASFACKAAIKAGDKLSEKEMRLLVDQLFATSMPYVCPHGRPILIKIPLEEFDRRFGR